LRRARRRFSTDFGYRLSFAPFSAVGSADKSRNPYEKAAEKADARAAEIMHENRAQKFWERRGFSEETATVDAVNNPVENLSESGGLTAEGPRKSGPHPYLVLEP
jgi:hypothetical protein